MLGSIIPALISGGSTLLGGLFNKPKNNRAHNKAVWKANLYQVKKANLAEEAWNKAIEAKAQGAADNMLKDALRLGINPVRYMEMGGLQHSFNVATIGLSKPAYSYHIRPEEAFTQTGQTMGETLQSAIGAFGSSLASGIQQEQQNAFQKDMLQMSLAAAQRGNGSGYSMAVPTAALFGSTKSRGAGSSGLATGGASMLTFHGNLTDMGGYDREAGDKIFGENLSPFMETAFKAPEFFKSPSNRSTMDKLFDELDRLGGDGVRYVWRKLNEAADKTPPAQLSRRVQAARESYVKRSIEQGIGNEDAIFNPGFW